jgi:2-phosphosulfolactate phosphatase
MHKLEVILHPLLFNSETTAGKVTVVVADILRATTTICSALYNGVAEIIPVADLETARGLKKMGIRVAAERDGSKVDFADFGNSPVEFSNGSFGGETIAFCTTNGTPAMAVVGGYEQLVLGSFSNFSALTSWLAVNAGDVTILCSGWKEQCSLEDTLFAGALAQVLLESGRYEPASDSVQIAVGLFVEAGSGLHAFAAKGAHAKRLTSFGYDADVAFAFECDTVPVVPVLKDGVLKKSYVNKTSLNIK